ncbi:MAG: hypothetical protein Ta2B_03950 [Termitinemataceae bacterium]|nr:MAG: hypothetical protein Ta2B_03950 [Termitinemataceae bacterium]
MNLRIFFCLPVFVFCSTIINAEETSFAEENAHPERVVLRWQPVDYASQYEVLVEKRTSDNSYTLIVDEVKRSSTELVCQLVPGTYRYQVIVYDIFDRGTVKSDWFSFEVVQKSKPDTKTEERLEDYEDELEQDKNIFNVTVAFEYTPIISFMNDSEGIARIAFIPLSFGFRLGVIPFEKKWGNIGFEFAPSVSLLKTDSDVSVINSVIFGFALNALYQYPLSGKMLINARLGGGLSMFYNAYLNGKTTDDILQLGNAFAPVFTACLSFQNYFSTTLFIDVGVQYRMFFFVNSVIQFVNPSISVGGRF